MLQWDLIQLGSYMFLLLVQILVLPFVAVTG